VRASSCPDHRASPAFPQAAPSKGIQRSKQSSRSRSRARLSPSGSSARSSRPPTASLAGKLTARARMRTDPRRARRMRAGRSVGARPTSFARGQSQSVMLREAASARSETQAKTWTACRSFEFRASRLRCCFCALNTSSACHRIRYSSARARGDQSGVVRLVRHGPWVCFGPGRMTRRQVVASGRRPFTLPDVRTTSTSRSLLIRWLAGRTLRNRRPPGDVFSVRRTLGGAPRTRTIRAFPSRRIGQRKWSKAFSEATAPIVPVKRVRS
jgi:hypothetical protein